MMFREFRRLAFEDVCSAMDGDIDGMGRALNVDMQDSGSSLGRSISAIHNACGRIARSSGAAYKVKDGDKDRIVSKYKLADILLPPPDTVPITTSGIPYEALPKRVDCYMSAFRAMKMDIQMFSKVDEETDGVMNADRVNKFCTILKDRLNDRIIGRALQAEELSARDSFAKAMKMASEVVSLDGENIVVQIDLGVRPDAVTVDPARMANLIVALNRSVFPAYPNVVSGTVAKLQYGPQIGFWVHFVLLCKQERGFGASRLVNDIGRMWVSGICGGKGYFVDTRQRRNHHLGVFDGMFSGQDLIAKMELAGCFSYLAKLDLVIPGLSGLMVSHGEAGRKRGNESIDIMPMCF